MKKILLVFLIPVLFISCYIAENNSGTGSITFSLPETMKAEAIVDQILKLRFFSDGEMLVLENLETSTIYYATDYPSPVSVTGQSEFSYTSLDSSGIVTVTGVPSEKPLQILAEYLVEYYAEGSGLWYIEKAGLSDPFTVGEGENTTVSIAILDAAYGNVKGNTSFSESAYFRAYKSEDLTAYFNLNTPISGEMTLNTVPTNYLSSGSSSADGSTFTFTDAVLPGRKQRILVSQSNNLSSPDYSSSYGLSDEFEVLPGRTTTVNMTYYIYRS